MRIRISHITRYVYDRPVALDGHLLRLRPRCDGTQIVEAFHLHVHPTPVTFSDWLDLDGNATRSAWFAGTTQSLTVASSCVVESLRENPFDFILEPRATSLPIQWTVAELAALPRYRQPAASSAELERLVYQVRHESGGLSSFFVTALAARIHELCRTARRPRGWPRPATETLREREGACRDLAMLYVEACRVAGVPARFVSGYHLPLVEEIRGEDRRELHAWAEVYLPGAGWRGFDPSTGLATSDRYVTVASGADPGAAAPISGTFRCSQAETDLTVDLDVSLADAPAERVA